MSYSKDELLRKPDPLDDALGRIRAARELIEDAGRHIECDLYESADVQAFLKRLDDALID